MLSRNVAPPPKRAAPPPAASGNEGFFRRIYRTYYADPVQFQKLVSRAQNISMFLGSIAVIKYYGQEFPFAAPSTAPASEGRQ
jgi:hypothetical protein